jgi:hypothetical protein
MPNVDGFPAVGFGAVAGMSANRKLTILDHPSLQFGSEPFAVIAVLRHRTPTTTSPEPEDAHGAIFIKACECANYIGVGFYANDVWPWHLRQQQPRSSFALGIAARTDYSTETNIGGFNDNRRYVVLASRIGNELAIYVDGNSHVAALTSPTLDISNPGVPITIGAHGTKVIQALEGEIFELIAIKGNAALRARERAACLLQKYGKH